MYSEIFKYAILSDYFNEMLFLEKEQKIIQIATEVSRPHKTLPIDIVKFYEVTLTSSNWFHVN